jgi:hypothetical protein
VVTGRVRGKMERVCDERARKKRDAMKIKYQIQLSGDSQAVASRPNVLSENITECNTGLHGVADSEGKFNSMAKSHKTLQQNYPFSFPWPVQSTSEAELLTEIKCALETSHYLFLAFTVVLHLFVKKRSVGSSLF